MTWALIPPPSPGPRGPLPTISEAALTPRHLHGEGGFATSLAFLKTEGSVDNILLKYSAIMYLVATNHREKYAH